MRRALFGLCLCGLGLAACVQASPDLGLNSGLAIEGAQYLPPGQSPYFGQTDGLQIISFAADKRMIAVGGMRNKLVAALAPNATAMVVGIVGASDAWVIEAGLPTLETPDLPSIDASFGLRSPAAPLGALQLQAVAVGSDGPGPRQVLDLVSLPLEPPSGELVVSLQWLGAADLDLHVVDPLGGEAWSGDPNTYQLPKPGEPIDPDGFRNGGILDRDANRDCTRNDTPAENVVWQRVPPVGKYIVRVATKAMCNSAIAHWVVTVTRNGTVIGTASGRSIPADELHPSRAGSGVNALEFALP